VHGAHQEVTGATRTVSGENPARAIGPVGCWRQPDHQNARPRITEPRDRAAPIDLVSMRRFLFYGDALTVRSQTLAAIARNYLLVNRRENAELPCGTNHFLLGL
jgi:hypothetical protein